MSSVSLKDFAEGRLNAPRLMLSVRLASLLAHVLVFWFGIWTRFPMFFAHFTNWTHFATGLYAILAIVCHVKYARANESVRTAPSALARFAYQLLSVFGPIHVIVTSTYWPACWTGSRKDTVQDILYLVLAHGLSFALLFLEKNLQGYRNQPKRLSALQVLMQITYVVGWAGFAGLFYLQTGNTVYGWQKGLPLRYYTIFIPAVLVANGLFRLGVGLFQ